MGVSKTLLSKLRMHPDGVSCLLLAGRAVLSQVKPGTKGSTTKLLLSFLPLLRIISFSSASFRIELKKKDLTEYTNSH